MSDLVTRRDLIKGGTMIAVGMCAPAWLSSIAHADVLRQAKGGKATSDTILVVCQLTGGNDGLNTLVPYSNPLYRSLRPGIGLGEESVLKLNEHMAFHPALERLHELYKEGKVAVVQNVGYPKANRSHFKSMDIWQSASPDGKLKGGWLGRHVDHQLAKGPLNPVYALGLSTGKPLSLVGKEASVPCFASLADIQNMLGDPDIERMLREIQGKDGATGTDARTVQQANKSALDAISQLKSQLGGFTPAQSYNNDAFGNGFKQIAQLVATSPATRVVYFSTGGFDTHARQPEQHQRLMKGFGDAVHAFQREMEAIGKADKVVVLAFSEFGRRAAENSSLGTDHGHAGPMFLVGKSVKGGLHGPNPDLQNLVNGDVPFTQDFRGVYAATLDHWMGGDSEVVLGQKFDSAKVFKT